MSLQSLSGLGRARVEEVAVESWVSSLDLSRLLTPQAGHVFKRMRVGNEADIRIDENITYQTVLGLGASLEHTTCANLSRLPPEVRAEVIERLVSPHRGIGMNSMRICIGTPDFTGEQWYTYDDRPSGEADEALTHFSIEKDCAYILPVLRSALRANPDLLFFASPWSPPGWMKTCGDLIGGHLYPKYFDAYAQYFVKFIRAYREEGIPVHAVTVQNEPGVNKRDDLLAWWYPSCQWSLVVDEDTWWPVPLDVMGDPERRFIRDHLGPAFKENGITTKIWCFDHNPDNLWYPRRILSDPHAARYVEGTAFHTYAGEPADVGSFHGEFPQKDVFLTEGSAYKVEGAVRIIDFLRNWVRTYCSWVTVIDSKGQPNRGPFDSPRTCVTVDADNLDVTYNFEYYMHGQFTRFVQRDASRIDSGPSGERFAHVAFKNPDGSVVVVVANAELEARSFTLSWAGDSVESSVPPESVATYRWYPH